MFAARGAWRARAGVRLFLIGTITLVHALTAVGSAVGADPDVDAGAGADAEAPPPLSKPPRLLRFVEATPPASLAADERADVVLTIDIDEQGRVADVAVAKSAAPRRRSGGGRGGAPVHVRTRRGGGQAGAGANHLRLPLRAEAAAQAGARRRARGRGRADRAARRDRAAQGRPRPDRGRDGGGRRRARGDRRRRAVLLRRAAGRRADVAAPQPHDQPRRHHGHASRPASGCRSRSTSTRRSATPRSCAGGARRSRPSSRPCRPRRSSTSPAPRATR